MKRLTKTELKKFKVGDTRKAEQYLAVTSAVDGRIINVGFADSRDSMHSVVTTWIDQNRHRTGESYHIEIYRLDQNATVEFLEGGRWGWAVPTEVGAE